MFLGLPDPNPDPLVRDTDTDPYVFCHTYRLVRGTDPDPLSSSKNSKTNIDSYWFVTLWLFIFER
jgi:hypothetical protein